MNRVIGTRSRRSRTLGSTKQAVADLLAGAVAFSGDLWRKHDLRLDLGELDDSFKAATVLESLLLEDEVGLH